MKTALIALFALVAIAVLAFVGYGRERTWATFFGPADLGPIGDLADLKPPAVPNNFLACPREVCVRAEPGQVPPVFAADPQRLRQELTRIIGSEPLVERVAREEDGLGDRYVQRSRVFRFPDTIVIRYIPVDVERTTVAIYSRSQLGSNDFGVNEARVRRWLSELEKAVPVVAAA